MMRKSKQRYNSFDNVLFWLRLASIDWSFGFNENPKEDSQEGKDGINSCFPDLRHIEKPVSESYRV